MTFAEYLPRIVDVIDVAREKDRWLKEKNFPNEIVAQLNKKSIIE
jgi:hypothetical protein